jgi:hypothetical protein
VAVKDENLTGIPLTMGSYYGATLDLKDSIIGNVGLTTVPTPTGQIAGHHTFDVAGFAVFDGTISTNLSGSEFSDVTTINIDNDSLLLNAGQIALTPQEGETLDVNGGHRSSLINDGTIEAESGPDANLKIDTNVVGFGTIELGVGAPTMFSSQSGTAEFGGYVGAGETFAFTGAVGATASDVLLQIDVADAFKATIANFTKTDSIKLENTAVTSDSFSGGVLTLIDGSHAVAHLHFSGSYTASDFTTQTVGGDTLIKLA